MRTAPAILFTVFLTGLVYTTSGQDIDWEFYDFLDRLEQAINTYVTFLPFTLPVGVIQNLRCTSKEFKQLCLDYEPDVDESDEILSSTATITALEKTIDNIFVRYKIGAGKNRKILEEIQTVDPIGLNVYLTKNNVTSSSPTFMDFVTIFMKTMKERVGLFSMKTNVLFTVVLPYINTFLWITRIPYHVRNELAKEYGAISHYTIDMFTNLVTKLKSQRIYPIATNDLNVYQEHESPEIDDVQIICGTYRDDETYWITVHDRLHAICICYRAFTGMVHVYDSSMNNWVDAREKAIIQKLYPYNKGIHIERPMTTGDQYPTCAIFAINYATMLFLNHDPAVYKIKKNEIHGDITLYMRIHILNILAIGELFLLK